MLEFGGERAMPKVGEPDFLWTTISPIDIGATSGRDVDIVVRNVGAPIPSHERDRIFERFYRGSAAHAPGTGMGLAIVRQIAHAHGGDVGVTSDASGTAIHLSLPLARVA